MFCIFFCNIIEIKLRYTVNLFIIFSVSYKKEYIPIGLAILDSICQTFFILPKLNNIIILQSLVSLRDHIYAGLKGKKSN